MFGSPVAYFFEYLLGIGQKPGTAGYRSLVIAPQIVSKCARMSGSMKMPNGTVAVSYEKQEGRICFRITVPTDTEAVFRYAEREYALVSGENTLELDLIG